MSLETQGIKLFWRDIPGFCRHILEAPEKFEKKNVWVQFSSPNEELIFGKGNRIRTTTLQFSEFGGYLMALTSSLNCLPPGDPYRTPHSLIASPLFTENPLFLTEKCFVVSPRRNSASGDLRSRCSSRTKRGFHKRSIPRKGQISLIRSTNLFGELQKGSAEGGFLVSDLF